MAIHNKTTDKKICIKIYGNTHDSLQQVHENKISINLPKNVLKLFHINHICKRSQSKGVFLVLKSANSKQPHYLSSFAQSLCHPWPCRWFTSVPSLDRFSWPLQTGTPHKSAVLEISPFFKPPQILMFVHFSSIKNNFEDRIFTCSLIYTSHPLTGPVLKR